jgi:hypothetical protein
MIATDDLLFELEVEETDLSQPLAAAASASNSIHCSSW